MGLDPLLQQETLLAGVGVGGGYQGLADAPWAVRGQSHTLGNPVSGLTPERRVPLASLKTSGTYWRAIKNLDSTPKHCTYTLTYSWKQSGGKKLKTAWGFSQFPVTTSACILAHSKHLQ